MKRQKLQCQALLAVRYTRDQIAESLFPSTVTVKRVLVGPDDDITLTYELTDNDPIPEGLRVGNLLCGELRRPLMTVSDIERREALPIFTGVQG